MWLFAALGDLLSGVFGDPKRTNWCTESLCEAAPELQVSGAGGAFGVRFAAPS